MNINFSYLFANCLLIVIALSTNAQSPEIWGVTSGGGKGFGTIFKLDENGENHSVEFEFGGIPFADALYNEFIEIEPGVLYGTANWGGNNNVGGIFRYNYLTGEYKTLHVFNKQNGTPGYRPGGSLVQGTNNILFGIMRGAGSKESGILYEYDMVNDEFHERIVFDRDTSGIVSCRGLMLANSGKLYGISTLLNKRSYLFEYDPVTMQISFPYHTQTMEGYGFQGRLIQGSNGKFYGMTEAGGSNAKGTIFEFDLTDSSWTVLHNFDGPNGRRPWASLTEVGNSRLFGMTSWGGNNDLGVLFEYNLLLDTFICHVKFDGANTGSKPWYNNLMQASNGKIYGMTLNGGNNDTGVLFEFDTTNNTFQVKYSFYSGGVGQSPGAGLLQASDGKLYGTTTNGTIQHNFGSIFSYDIGLDNMTLLDYFHDQSQGVGPLGKLLHHSNGLLYGTTGTGGDYNEGVLYSFNPNTKEYSIKHHLEYGNGGFSDGSLLEGNGGKIYGTRRYLASWGDGVLYSYDPILDSFKVEVEFDKATTGANPMGGLISNGYGNYYGLLTEGGIDGLGTIYSFNPVSGIAKKVYDFEGIPDKAGFPVGELTMLPGGMMYGMTSRDSRIFSFNPSNNEVNMLARLSWAKTGNQPKAGLSPGPDGLLYGTTYTDSVGGGTIFSFNPTTFEITKLVNIGSVAESRAVSKLLWASNNKLYGTAGLATSNDDGFIFEYDVATETYNVIHDCIPPTGIYPGYALTELYGLNLNVNEPKENLQQVKVYPNPSQGLVEISFESTQSRIHLELIEIPGAKLNSWTFTNTNHETIDLSNYSTGIYMLRVSTKDNIETVRILKK
jgi:uncharacterized repeat protein (TIGR03803 family)